MEGDRGIFHGLRFRLEGFDIDEEDKYCKLIKENSGAIEKKYDWEGLYFVTSNETTRFADPICEEARKNGAIVVNKIWLDDSLKNGELVDISKILYRPPMALSGVKGAQLLKIACIGFASLEALYLEKLIELMGAELANVTDCKYLICNTYEDYEASKALHIFKINKNWLEESVKPWEILSVDGFISWPRRARRSYRTPSKGTNDMDNERKSRSTGKNDGAQTGGGKGSPEERNINKRQALSTGSMKPQPPAREPVVAPCKRSLNFNWKRLSEYKELDLTFTVQIPRSAMHKEIGTDVIKGALLGCYTAMANIHSGGECIRNSFSSSSFLVSLNSEEVRIEDVQLVEFEQKIANRNKDQFVHMVTQLFKERQRSVPDDIGGWLLCISARVSDRVLKRHINMQHPVDIFGSFTSMYYIVVRLKEEDVNEYNKIMKSKQLVKYNLWRKTFKWKLLNDTLTYIHPNLRTLASNSGGQPIIVKPKVRADEAFGILDVVRDCIIHPAVCYQHLLLPVMLLEKPTLLSDLQESLFQLGHLPNLR